MVSDQEIATGVEMLLCESDPNAATSLNTVVQQLEVKLGLDLSHKVDFIRDQITFLLRSQPVPKEQLSPQPQYLVTQPFHQPHFTFHHHQQQQPPRLYQQNSPTVQTPPHPPHQVLAPAVKDQNSSTNASDTTPKGRSPAGSKRRGGSGGLNKVCGVSPKLQAIVGEPELPRTEIVKQLWVYIRKHNLQDPGNKRIIICDEALRSVFETDSTDMFKMNKLLAKHILPLDPKQAADQAKKLKIEDEPAKGNPDSSSLPAVLSEALAKFFGTGEKEMLQSEALGRVREYIKVNQLEDPLNPMVVHCDAKLQELLGCENVSALGIQDILVRYHFLKQ